MTSKTTNKVSPEVRAVRRRRTGLESVPVREDRHQIDSLAACTGNSPALGTLSVRKPRALAPRATALKTRQSRSRIQLRMELRRHATLPGDN